VNEVLISSRFKRDAPDFNINLITDCEHRYSARFHKFETSINGSHVFRALVDGLYVVYVIDKDHRLIFLRAFRNVHSYEKFLIDKKAIHDMIEMA
jgi:hypothetical protein